MSHRGEIVRSGQRSLCVASAVAFCSSQGEDTPEGDTDWSSLAEELRRGSAVMARAVLLQGAARLQKGLWRGSPVYKWDQQESSCARTTT